MGAHDDISAGGSEGKEGRRERKQSPWNDVLGAAYQTLSVATCGGIDLGRMSPTNATET
jgi:hypothetical protein